MTLVFGALAWFVAGRTWLTNIIAAITIGSLAAFGGYLYGRYDQHTAHQLAEMTAQRDFFQAEMKRQQEAAEVARRLVDEMQTRDDTNKPIEADIEKRIEGSPVVSGCVPGKFLDGLRRLK